MPNDDLWLKARQFRRAALECGDLVVYRALLDVAEACEEMAVQEALDPVAATTGTQASY